MRLEDARNFSQFIQDHEDEEAWIIEKQLICKAGIFAKDLRAVLSLQQKHKVKNKKKIYIIYVFLDLLEFCSYSDNIHISLKLIFR